MLARAGQMFAGAVVLLIGGGSLLFPILKLGEQPDRWLLVVGAILIIVGLWLAFPMGMGKLGTWAVEHLPWLHDHNGGDDD